MEYITFKGLCEFVILGLIVYIILFSKWFRIMKLALSLPGPPAWPIIGNAYIATNNKVLLSLGYTLNQKYGSLARIWISLIPAFFISEPNDLQKVLASYQNTDKSFVYSLMHNFLGEGLITNNGDKWKLHRKIVQPIFHKHLLQFYVENFTHLSKYMIQELDQTIKNKNDLNITTYINKIVIQILNETVLGINDKKTLSNNLSSPFREGKVLTQTRLVNPWLLIDFIFQFTTSAKEELNQKKRIFLFTKKIMEQKREERKNSNVISKISFLDKMIDIAEENSEFCDTDIINEICTFMLAGQDSVSSGLAFCLYFLAKHQDIQERAFEEVHEILNDSKGDINMENLKSMKYLEQCIKETMRLCPSVPIMSRILSEDVSIGNTTLPAGSNIFISPFVTHHLPNIYPDPIKFDPDRFSAYEVESRHPFAYLPFSCGPRNCIGNKFAMMEMKTVVSIILNNYHLSITPGYQLELSFRITLRAKGGIWLRFQPRK